MTLLTELLHTGPPVRAVSDWATSTNQGRDRIETVGIMNHWDAIVGSPTPAYYMNRGSRPNRLGGILYHIVIRRDGLVDLLSQRYVWHAGMGDYDVLTSLQAAEIPLPPNSNDSNGNAHTFSVALNYHPTEGPVGPAQYESLTAVNSVLLEHFGLSRKQIIDHRGWTDRKIDINTLSMPQLRSDASEGGDDLAHLTEAQQKDLVRFLAELKNVNSDVSFVRYLIPWYRKWRSFSPSAFLRRGDKVKLT